MDLGLTQAGLAERLGRTARAVANWNSGATEPLPASWAGIARVLGDEMLPREAGIAARLLTDRWRLGLTQAELAVNVGLDPRTIRNVEKGRHQPSRATQEKLRPVVEAPPLGPRSDDHGIEDSTE